MELHRHISQLGGFAATHELYALDWSRGLLRSAVQSGQAIRVRQGWYCTPDANPSDIAAFRVGGRLACISAAREHGLWVRNSSRIHVEVEPSSSRHRSPMNSHVRLARARELAVLHWHPSGGGRSRSRASVLEALRAMILCQSPELVVAAADSALRFEKITADEWGAAVSGLPRRLRRLLQRVDARSESITESLLRFRLEQLGIDNQIQVGIAGVGRVDFLIGTSLVIEVDGFAYHSDRDQFERDRKRDARLAALGYRTLRFSYRQVMESWPEVRAAIVAAIALGDHFRK